MEREELEMKVLRKGLMRFLFIKKNKVDSYMLVRINLVS